MHIHSQQHCYTSHVYYFGQNILKTQRQLPRLPSKLNILVIKPTAAKGSKYLSQQFTKQYTIKHFIIVHWLSFLKINYLDYRDVKIYSNQLTSLPKNGFILDQLPFINEPDSNSNNLRTYPPPGPQAILAFTGNHTPIINHPPVRLSDNIQDSEFDDDVLDTLVPDLVPNLSKLKLLSHEVQY